ncbi:hypothetical protein HanRHA438_Chr10g0456721 [Helianthus annuus]|nr:hypothetical protein HanHA300_Chr10g0365441 [Helianthus annuus]KAJ0522147.1 hypothetical protein HanIR_Chr10g0479161 [Helianthus annuus]KAJ0530212.1 hypothetical protein HanHA89_Chr10g0387051 [Helianthus annuus]KAJ0697084.1 hypothetical protein HanLR1_Chr10g0364721 [Helianthus annuus]KAJ0879891.1 hypothetical protein HanRHA438_Chr10g0456721 [Helianthus annuus]
MCQSATEPRHHLPHQNHSPCRQPGLQLAKHDPHQKHYLSSLTMFYLYWSSSPRLSSAAAASFVLYLLPHLPSAAPFQPSSSPFCL